MPLNAAVVLVLLLAMAMAAGYMIIIMIFRKSNITSENQKAIHIKIKNKRVVLQKPGSPALNG